MATNEYGYSANHALINASAASSNLIVTAVAGHQIKVINVVLQASGAVSVRWDSGTTPLTGPMPQVANTGYAPPEARFGHFITASGQGLYCHLSAAVPVAGWVVYELT